VTIERLRGRKLQDQRKRVWLDNPRCARCGLVTVFPSGFELDHKTALADGGTNDDNNMQVLHHQCHVDKTNEDMGFKPQVTTGLDGFPVVVPHTRASTARWKRVARGK
jgi:5-methylcytosine-specific restriction endonuclease McrA